MAGSKDQEESDHMSRTAAPNTGYDVDVDVIRVESIPTPKNKGGGRRWRLHTTTGLYLTAQGSPANKALTGKETGPMTLTVSDNTVIAVAIHGA